MSANILQRLKQIARLLTCATALFFLAGLALAQEDQEAKGICFPQKSKTAVIGGFIGGESHDSYVFHVRAGRKVTVRITSRANRAGFSVSTSEFGEPVSFGKETDGGMTWTGTIPQTGVYFISVTAHPQARYTLKVTKEGDDAVCAPITNGLIRVGAVLQYGLDLRIITT